IIRRSDGSYVRGISPSVNGDTVYCDWNNWPDPVVNLSAQATGEETVVITFSQPQDADDRKDHYKYRIYRSTDPMDTGYELITSLDTSITTYTDSGLITGVTYYYRVTTVDTGDSKLEGRYSARAGARPDVPVNVIFNVDAGLLDPDTAVMLGGNSPLSGWGNSASIMTDTDGDGIWTVTIENIINGSNLEYKYLFDGQYYEELAGGGNRTITVDTNIPGAMLIYNNWGETPSAPVLTYNVDSGVIILYFTVPDYDVNRFKVYRKPSSGNYSLISDISYTYALKVGNQVTYTDTNVIVGETYTYVVKAVDSTDSLLESDSSNTITTTPGYLGDVTFRVCVGTNPDIIKVNMAGNFNNWSVFPDEMTRDTANPDYWYITKQLVVGKLYYYKYVINNSIWESSFATTSGNREVYISVLNINNWEDTPDAPEIDVYSESGSVQIIIDNYPMDCKEFRIYRTDSGLIAITSETTYYDYNVNVNDTYYYYVVTVDYGGLWSDSSNIDSAVPGIMIHLYVYLDIKDALNSGLITDENGISFVGLEYPLVTDTDKSRMTKVEPGVYLFDTWIISNSLIRYIFVANPLTSNQKVEEYKYEFSYYAPSASSVYVAGTFNNWDIQAFPLSNDGSGTWVGYIYLSPGYYEYKFIINGNWEGGNNRSFTIENRKAVIGNILGLGIYKIYNTWGESYDIYPGAPDGISYYISDSTVAIGWVQSKEFDVAGYSIYRSTDATITEGDLVAWVINDTYYFETGLLPGQTYYYALKAIDFATNSGELSEVQKIQLIDTGASWRKYILGDLLTITVGEKDVPRIWRFRGVRWGLINELALFKEEFNTVKNKIDNANKEIIYSSMLKFISGLSASDTLNPICWVEFYDTAMDVIHNFNDSLVIVFSAPKSLPSDVNPASLAPYVLNENSARWERLDGYSTTTSGTITLTRYQNSIYIIVGVPGALNDLSQLIVFPNPFYKHKSVSGYVHFINIPPDFEYIKIFNVAGELVSSRYRQDANPQGNNIELRWDIKNDAGREVASGMYIYYIKTARDKRIGKIGIIK
ncbi:MAG: hypothetical protein AB1765_11300, partial [Candidatus Hydrogenedentota bacterium]